MNDSIHTSKHRSTWRTVSYGGWGEAATEWRILKLSLRFVSLGVSLLACSTVTELPPLNE